MKFLIIFFLLISTCYAGEVLYPTPENPKGEIIKFNDKYSFKNFTDANLSTEKDLKDMVIYASCFSKQTPDSKVFPDDMTGVTFLNCNLDNCYIPAGNTVIGGSQRRLKIQNDTQYWFVDENNIPIEPLRKEKYLELGLSIDPKDLPITMMKEDIIITKRKELDEKNITPIIK